MSTGRHDVSAELKSFFATGRYLYWYCNHWGAAMKPLSRSALGLFLLMVVQICDAAVVWKHVDVAEYTTGPNIRFDGHPVVNRVLALEAVGPPRSVAEAKHELLRYAQDTVEMAMASALAAFYATPGEIGTRSAAAFGQFKATIAYRASINTAFRKMAYFEIRVVDQRVPSDKVVGRLHFPVGEISSEAAHNLKKAFPMASRQIQDLSNAYTYFAKLENPDVAFSWNIKETADRLKMPDAAVSSAVQQARQFASRGPDDVRRSIDNSAREFAKAVRDAPGGKNSVVRNPGQILGGSNSVARNPGQVKGGGNSVVNHPQQLWGQ
jgi:hypothetical protein